MKVLLPGPCFDDSFSDNVRHTLEQMGHEVISPPARRHSSYYSLPRYALRVARERFSGGQPSRAEWQLLRLAKARAPDVVLCPSFDVHPEILDELGKLCPGRRILWWGDAPANSQRWGLVNPGWDWVFVKDPAAVTKLRIAGRNAHLLHEAMNPSWHRPLARQANDCIAVAGNFYGYWQAVVLRLMTSGVRVTLFGSKPPIWAAASIKKQWSGRYITREDKSQVFGEALACLNTFALAEGNSLNCRAFEIAGAGGLQLMEARPIVSECFEPGVEVLIFTSFEELLALLQRCQKSPAEMQAIRTAAARRALAEHTYRHRLDRIFGYLKS